MSKILALLVTPPCSFYFDSSFLFYTLLGKANKSKQQNNKGEAASTSSISSGAGGQGNGGLFSNGEFFYHFIHTSSCERRALRSYAISRLGVVIPELPNLQGTVRLVQWYLLIIAGVLELPGMFLVHI